MSATTVAKDQTETKSRWRSWGANLLLLLFVLSSVLSLFAISVRNELLDTDSFVSTATELAEDPAVQEMVATNVTSRLVEAIDFGLITEDSRTVAQAISVPLTLGIEDLISDYVLQFTESDEFATLWTEAITRLHPRMVDLLTGETSGLVSSEDGSVTIDLTPVLQKVQTDLEGRGVTFFRVAAEDQPELVVTVIESDTLESAQAMTSKLLKWAEFLPVIAVIALFFYFLASYDRWSASLTAPISFSVAMALTILVVERTEKSISDHLTSDAEAPALTKLLDIITDDLRNDAMWLLLMGVGISILAWLLSKVFRQADDATSPKWNAVLERFPSMQRSSSWLGQHQRGFSLVMLALFSVLVAFWDGFHWSGWLALAVVPAIAAVTVVLFASKDQADELTPVEVAAVLRKVPVDPYETVLSLTQLYSRELITDEEFLSLKNAALTPSTAVDPYETMLSLTQLCSRGLITDEEFLGLKQAALTPSLAI